LDMADSARTAIADLGESSLVRGGVGPSCSTECDWDSTSISAIPD